MTTESYTVIIRGGNGAFGDPNRVSGNGTDGVYRVDWASILPQKYKRFSLRTSFTSDLQTTYLPAGDAIVYIECSAFGKQGFYDTIQRNRGNVVCIARMNPVNANLRIESFTHEHPIMVQYPTENQFNIRITGGNGASRQNTLYAQWVLVMTFTPID